ncbi:DUF2808 domain-containing protein [Cyanobium sp. HWJ4-Hawea]|uniref:DUF2808 domain-containing protein n=1 Tax=Cyanobium sp. HWJ4-Hawea TaxID=2823713 RepID=UPI0020CC5D73|nr:DUF2808 domain-containing protein [Cyanobium sp. HWJ4-Hawea]MCP9807862.1 DUF2808 domain-containing protein [Cyanobium sp. HWJ4-Hawea]
MGLRNRLLAIGACALGAGALPATGLAPLLLPAAQAQTTPSVMEFRWDADKDYKKLYYFVSNARPLARADYYFILKPKDRKTAILKLSITIPKYFDAKIDTKQIKLCKMSEGGMLKRTRCEKDIPATIELADKGNAIEVFPNTPVSDEGTIGVYMQIFNPFNPGMYQFNALAQAPGDIPIAGYLGSWLIQLEPPSN